MMNSKHLHQVQLLYLIVSLPENGELHCALHSVLVHEAHQVLKSVSAMHHLVPLINQLRSFITQQLFQGLDHLLGGGHLL